MEQNTKSGFVRGIWGIYDIDKTLGKPYSRRTKIDNDIALAKLNPYAPKCKVYVFGEDNFKRIVDKGFAAVLIDKKPICWDMLKEQYRHKIEIWKAGLQDFDEIVFLDWDCVPCAHIPNDFWKVMASGSKVRTTLFQYVLRRALFRNNDARKLSASTFVYIRGKEVADGIIKTWEDMGRPWQEEIALSKYIDDTDGGWKGIENYRIKFEQPYHTLFWYYPPEYIKDVRMKYNIFFHLNCNKVLGLLGDGNPYGVKQRLDSWYQGELNGMSVVYERSQKTKNKGK